MRVDGRKDALRRSCEGTIGLAKPVTNDACIATPQNVVDGVAIEITDLDDLPRAIGMGVEVGPIIRKSSVGLAEPIGDGAVISTPQEVAKPVAVEVAGADNMPGRTGVDREIGPVVEETAVRLTEPVGDCAVVGAPHDVAQAIAVEVAGADDVPARTGID